MLRNRIVLPLFSAWLVYGLLCVSLLLVSLERHQDQLIYPFDDTYIHLSMARNFAMNGSWGVNASDGFASSSSSPLWTALLALCDKALGESPVYPLVLNLAAGLGVAALLTAIFLRGTSRGVYAAVSAALVILWSLLPVLALAGMEHSLQTLLCLGFVWTAARRLNAGPGAMRRGDVFLIGLAALLTAVRYEGLFLVLPACVLLALSRRLLLAVVVGAAAALPVLGYGLISTLQGWYFLPNSLLLKGSLPGLSAAGALAFFNRTVEYLTTSAYLFALLVGALAVFLMNAEKRPGRDENKYFQLIFLGGAALHSLFASTGSAFRYDAYLVCLGLTGTLLQLGALLPNPSPRLDRSAWAEYLVRAALAFLLILPLSVRAGVSLKLLPVASTNIYEQQMQMAAFLKQSYPGETVAVNDIGVVSYLGGGQTLDLWGLGNMEVARMRLQGQYGPEQIDQFARRNQARLALVFDDWFAPFGGLPPNWIKVGTWKISNNAVSGGDTVSIYALDAAAKPALLEKLSAFSKRLPAGVQVQLYE